MAVGFRYLPSGKGVAITQRTTTADDVSLTNPSVARHNHMILADFGRFGPKLDFRANWADIDGPISAVFAGHREAQ